MATAPIFPSPVVPMALTPKVLDNVAPVLTLCPSVVPMAFSSFLQPDDSIRSWLTSTLPLALAPFVAEAVPISPAVAPVVAERTEAAPVVKKSRKPKATEVTAMDKTPRKRSQMTATAR
jgi:hypothetical protein